MGDYGSEVFDHGADVQTFLDVETIKVFVLESD